MSTPPTPNSTNNTTSSSPPTHENDDDSNDTLLCLNFNQDGGCLAVGTAHGFRICNSVPFQETFRRTFHANSNSNMNSNLNLKQKNHELVSNSKSDGCGNDNGDEKKKKKSAEDEKKNEPSSSSSEPINHSATSNSSNSSNSGGGGGGIGHIEMLYRCNLLALVGGGTSPQYQKNKVLIWDDHLKRPIGELRFRHAVLSVKLRRDRICVALKDRVYVYNFGSLALLDTIVTGFNPLGLLCISTNTTSDGSIGKGSNSHKNRGNEKNHEKDDSGMVLACPSVQTGQARVELYGKRKTLLIDAHESTLSAMALSVDGKYLATASERGTIIRLFSTQDSSSSSSSSSSSNTSSDGSTGGPTTTTTPLGIPLREFRRGVEQAKIESLCFSFDKCWLACASDRGTVHIFQVEEEEKRNDHDNGNSYGKSSLSSTKSKKKSSSFTSSFAKKMIPSILSSVVSSPRKYLLDGEHSYVQVRGITYPKKCAFVAPHTIAIAGLDDCGNGCLLLASFGPPELMMDGQNGSIVGKDSSSYNKSSSLSSTSATKGEARRIAYHRFFKRGKYDRNDNHHLHHQNGNLDNNVDYNNGQQLKFTDVKNEFIDDNNDDNHNEINVQKGNTDDEKGEEDGITKKIEEMTFDEDEGFVSIIADDGSDDEPRRESKEVNNETEIKAEKKECSQ